MMTQARNLAFVCLLLLASCSGPEPESYFDLVTRFDGAAVDQSTPVSPEGLVPLADPGADVLFLPVGSAVSYTFEGRAGSTLRASRLAFRGEGTQLAVSFETDQNGKTSEVRTAASTATWSVPIPLHEPQPIRVTLEVTSAGEAPGDGVVLKQPEIWGEPDPPAPASAPPESRTMRDRPNVVIYLIDTLRRDRLGCYGYERPVSPNIDAFAQTATVFDNSIGQASWTKPSVSSLFTGVWPPVHGATGWGHRLPEEFETIAERLQAAGYRTAAFVTNINASATFGLSQGFEDLWYKRKVTSDLVNEAVFEWLEAYDGRAPMFLYVHTMDPHAGYFPKEPFRSRFAPTADQMPSWKPRWKWPNEVLPFLSDQYDGEIAQNDDAFGKLIERLREQELFEKSTIVVLSDHGEEFLEHNGWRHGRVLHGGSLNVPLIVKFPNQQQPKRSETPVSHVDILPTVLDVAGFPPFADAEGQSLRLLQSTREKPVFSHLRLGKAPLQYSVNTREWKLIQVHKNWKLGPGQEEGIQNQLFNVHDDPGETKDLAEELPVRTSWLAGLLEEHLASGLRVEEDSIELTDEIRSSLRALGYLQ